MTHTAYIEAECGIFGNQTLKVEFDYTPAEKECFEYPGCDERYYINAIHIVLVPGFRPMVWDKRPKVEEVLIDVTKLDGIDEQAIIDLIREVES